MSRLESIIKSFLREEDGAVVTEYGMLIVVVVLGLAIVLGMFRQKVASWFGSIGNNLNALNENTGP